MNNLNLFVIITISLLLTSCNNLYEDQIEILRINYPSIEIHEKSNAERINSEMVFNYLPSTKGKIKFKGATLIENCKIGKNNYTVLTTTSKLLGTSVWLKGLNDPNKEFAFLQVNDKLKFENLCLIKSVCLQSIMSDRGITVSIPLCLKTTMASPNCEMLFKQVQCKNDKDC